MTGEPNNQAQRRRRARGFGIRAEWAALAWLVLHGWHVLARNYRINTGEIDLIASRRGTIAFVEVKARPDIEMARTAVTPQKRQRISRAAAHWLTRNRWAIGYVLRGDAVFIAPRSWPVHEPNVFELNLF